MNEGRDRDSHDRAQREAPPEEPVGLRLESPVPVALGVVVELHVRVLLGRAPADEEEAAPNGLDNDDHLALGRVLGIQVLHPVEGAGSERHGAHGDRQHQADPRALRRIRVRIQQPGDRHHEERRPAENGRREHLPQAKRANLLRASEFIASGTHRFSL